MFNVTRDSTGYAATMDSPDQGATGIPVSQVTVAADSVFFEVDVARAGFAGLYDKETGHIDGFWSQSGLRLPLSLARTTDAKQPD